MVRAMLSVAQTANLELDRRPKFRHLEKTLHVKKYSYSSRYTSDLYKPNDFENRFANAWMVRKKLAAFIPDFPTFRSDCMERSFELSALPFKKSSFSESLPPGLKSDTKVSISLPFIADFARDGAAIFDGLTALNVREFNDCLAANDRSSGDRCCTILLM